MAEDPVTAPAPSTSQLAYDFLRARIDGGRYLSGDRLVLGQIAAELSISVVPVREAFRASRDARPRTTDRTPAGGLS